ncbi:MAG: hypothetical protein IID38_10775, partial [Planctomycetes bacterium]|nr:hypothetical protein [Planctomycetota bacterium]
MALPTPHANITRAFFLHDRRRGPLTLQFNNDATAITLHVPSAPPEGGNIVVLETAEKSGQHPGGRIVFSALDAKVHGTRAKLETHVGNHRIGYWTNADDYVTWAYSATRPGMYEVELTYSVAGGGGNEIAIEMAGKT